MTFPFRFAALALTALPLAAITLQVDFDHAGTTQSGWQSIAAGDSALGDSWSKNFTGGVSLDVDAVGGIVLDTRDRAGANGGGGEASMWRDFLFANGSTSSATGSGLSLAFTGLQANSEYPVKIWAHDSGSVSGRAADWSGGGSAVARLVTGGTPATLADSFVTINVTTNGSGAVTISGIVSAINPNGSHNVFVNGLEIGDPVSTDGPTDIALSNLTIAKTAPIGTNVGSLSTTDPTPGDTFTYTLVPGTGSTDNAQFVISGSALETDRDLSGFPGGTILSARVRSTDAAGAFAEKAFQIEVVNDSDADGLDDSWELTYFPNLATATGSGNNDSDSLTNLQEQSAGTNPTLADTDGDTLDDDDEINVHGTNPLLMDTDGEGINDADELSSANGYVTNPTLADTDADGFNDALETSEGTDPTNSADFPNTLIPLQLNEILARNSTGLADGFGKREDWIEIYNPNNSIVNLDGYYMTDNTANLTKWNFPAVTVQANSYLIVWASGKDVVDSGGAAHTNFSLSAGGEYLAIVRPDGTTVDDSFSPVYPEQFTDISYGIPAAGGAAVFFQSNTPGAVNSSSAFPGVVKDTNFTFDRGFYNAPLLLEITSATAGATIRYTLDGSMPTSTSGTIYSGPISITTTETVRAIATFSDWLPTNVDTHSYIYVDDVVQQPTDPAGWPSDWGNHDGLNIPSDYEMDPRVVNNTNGLGIHTVQEALLDIPTVSISMNIDDFISDASGIYANPQNRTEKVCAIEYINPDGSPGFQEDCKIEIQGNASRRPARMQKHSIRLTFSSTVGIPKLDFPLFPQSEVEEFNKLVLRACFTDSWALVSWGSNRYRPNDSMYMRDVWMKDSMGAMGNATGNGDFVHLYVNGLYFGLHDLTERIEDDWYAEHLGGDKDDWEVNADILTPGPLWNSMISTVNGNITDNAVYEQAKNVIDIDNYIDYTFLHFYADAEDWPTKNGYAGVNAASGDGRWRFQVWDQEISLDSFGWNRYNSNSGSMIPFQRLRLNDEFRIRFADRVAMHVYNGGVLSEQNSGARYSELATEIDKAIVAESARWGDVQANTPYGNTAGTSTDPFADFYPPTINSPIYFTREQHWAVELDHVVNTHIPIINDASDSRGIIRELRANNLYPSIDAPIYSQHGGIVPNGNDLTVTTSTGAIYYTTDGSDPREVGGEINPGAGMLVGGANLDTFIDFEATGWRYLDTGVAQSDSQVVVGHPSYGTADWKHPLFNDNSWGTGQAMLGYGAVGGITRNTTVGPETTPRHLTTYFRKEFTVTGASDYTQIATDIIRDDGAIVYLNGKELDRTNLVGGNISFSTTATSASPEDEVVPLAAFILSPGDLIEGVNVIAVEVHQTSTGSSDLGLDLRLRASKPNAGSNIVTLTETGTLNSRALNGGEWSALTTADFIVGTPASSSSLVVSEIYYNPPGPDESTEWIELMNISNETIDLTDVSLTGITYIFPTGTLLAAGQRIVLVKDQAAFAAAYSTAGINIAPGAFTSSLSNNGEEIAIIDSTGLVDIQRLQYLDVAPWPTAPDGSGFSLVLIAPDTGPDLGIGSNWRSSVALGGTPGTTDATIFSGDPDADADGDGVSAFLEYAFGTISGETGSSPEAAVVISPGLFSDGVTPSLEITYRKNIAADDLIFEAQTAPDLQSWSEMPVELVSTIANGDGTELVTYRSTTPFGS
ncbi:lamin tail domain-containing protein, partial [Akkermansiaceae bacterium]|nr:lamin tail domain-containing protein [Akkermansiaceae bacterium]